MDTSPPSDLRAGQAIATWPLVDCAGSECTAQPRWRDCWEKCVTVRQGAGVFGDDEDEFRVEYYCPECMAAEWGCDVGDAIIRIRDGKPTAKRRREENAAFKGQRQLSWRWYRG